MSIVIVLQRDWDWSVLQLRDFLLVLNTTHATVVSPNSPAAFHDWTPVGDESDVPCAACMDVQA